MLLMIDYVIVSRCEFALEAAHCHIVLISQCCNFMLVNIMYLRILIL